jgi:RNA polymerase sigma-70 factor (ECF subfamily)
MAGRDFGRWYLWAMSQLPADRRYAEIQSHQGYLMRYALALLRDSQLAEEAVQEALLAALEGIGSFDGRSSLRTWLTSILRFKVVDLQRRAVKERAHVDVDEQAMADGDDSWLDDFFDDTGHWRVAPQAWSDPESALEQRRFWEAFERCLSGLSETAGRVFFRREVLGDDTEAICRDEAITPSNCWVILHRARIALRGCLGRNWFGESAADGR